MPEGYSDRRIREELHPGKQGRRAYLDFPSPLDCRASDRRSGCETSRYDALDCQEQISRSIEELRYCSSGHHQGMLASMPCARPKSCMQMQLFFVLPCLGLLKIN